MLIDTHAHLDFPDFADDLDTVLARAADAGVTRIVTIGTSVASSRHAVALAERYAQVFAVIGVHPNSAAEAEADFIGELRELARSPRVVAIGETGLDYFRLPEGADVNTWQAAQAAVLTQQLDLAAELGLNVVIHEREAWADTVELLRPYSGKVRGVFHCFGKSSAQAAEILALGHLVSFTGIVTFKNAPEAHATATRIPGDAFMVETDCPFLAPVPFRGKRCEPAYTRQIAERVAQLRGEPLAMIAAQTTATAEAFFRFRC